MCIEAIEASLHHGFFTAAEMAFEEVDNIVLSETPFRPGFKAAGVDEDPTFDAGNAGLRWHDHRGANILVQPQGADQTLSRNEDKNNLADCARDGSGIHLVEVADVP